MRRLLTWTVRFAVFLFLVALAAKNTAPVTLRFYFDLALEAPLIVLLFGFFAAGAVLGILAIVPALLGQRRDLSRLRRESAGRGEPAPPAPGA